METTAFLFLTVLLCSVYGNPLGQTTVCESQPSILPGLLAPGIGGYPYVGGIGYPPIGAVGAVGPLGSTTVCESTSLPYVPFPMAPSTVCESFPNVGLGYPFGYGIDPLNYGLWPYNNLGKTTVCETSPNVGVGLPYGLGLGPLLAPLPGALPAYGIGSTTVCESSPNLPLPVLPYPRVAPYPLINGLGQTTVCESTPNVLSPFGYGVPFL